MMRYGLLFLLTWMTGVNATPTVNVYVWGGEIPHAVIQQFEASTGIKVHFSTYDSNETLYAKLKANPKGSYDVIMPSTYYVERMKSQGMLARLDPAQLGNLNHLDPFFKNNAYDPQNAYSAPLIWGATGIFYNHNYVKQPPMTWAALWHPNYKNQLLLLDDSREVFAMALMALGYSADDANPTHIKAAFNHLLLLIPNIKLFSTEGIQALLIDEDTTLGMAWNGDVYKSHLENNALEFIYPKEGFVIWIDCLAIPFNAPHPIAAHAFINFLFRPEIAQQIARSQGHAITNATAKAQLPQSIQDDPMVYPPDDIRARGTIQRYPGEQAVNLLNQYWQALKLAF
jgi:spermidine/putrescine transport system substrate-binding protein